MVKEPAAAWRVQNSSSARYSESGGAVFGPPGRKVQPVARRDRVQQARQVGNQEMRRAAQRFAESVVARLGHRAGRDEFNPQRVADAGQPFVQAQQQALEFKSNLPPAPPSRKARLRGWARFAVHAPI